MRLLLILTIFAFIVSCEKDISNLENDNIAQNPDNGLVESSFFITDSLGNISFLFKEKEDIFFRYTIKNNTFETLYGNTADESPIAFIKLFCGDSLIGTSHDGYGYRQTALGYKIYPGDSIYYQCSWYSNPSHDLLTAGNYKTLAVPQLHIRDYENSLIEFEEQFSVTK